ncbi:MAG: RnfABCDGE type electron transport complex subunit B [Planctomycetota bacterium]|jgi:Na+-translocating ferredoxin:NAD+ oxidoreductase RNF subunit RnfB
MIVASIVEIINNAWPAAALALGLGSLFALILLIASIKLKVEVDPKVQQVHAALPNIDCGACGFAGCGSYAKAIVADPELLGKCAPGGSDTSNEIAQILNLQMSGSGAPARPIVHCRAHGADRMFFASYDGIPSCTTVDAVPNVQACKFGCLGYGDCVRSCQFDALHVVDGLATVDYEKCTGCTACSKACPRVLIEMVPFTQDIMMTVACNSKENGKNTRTFCKVGCIGCGMCSRACELFSTENNLAKLDFANYAPSEEAQTAMDKCPTGNIVFRGKDAPAPRPAGQKPKPAAKKE